MNLLATEGGVPTYEAAQFSRVRGMPTKPPPEVLTLMAAANPAMPSVPVLSTDVMPLVRRVNPVVHHYVVASGCCCWLLLLAVAATGCWRHLTHVSCSSLAMLDVAAGGCYWVWPWLGVGNAVSPHQ